MRRFVVVASMIASGVACVNLDKPEQVAECAMTGTCVNGKLDAALAPDAPLGSGPDANPRGDEGPAVNHDGNEIDGSGATTLDGGPLHQDDVAILGADGPDGPIDLAAPDVPPGACNFAGAPRPAGTVCRAAVDLCDVAEVCDGVSLDCPADKLAAAATPCRPVAGDCDIAETCDGARTACPIDGFKATGTVCRPVAGVCDVAESCDGTSAACPVDSVAPSTTVCRASTDNDQCDPAEKCAGIGVDCPADVKYTKPAPPTGATATGGSLLVTVSWTASADATGYNVKQSMTGGTGYTTLISSPTTTTSPFVDTGLAGNTTYYYVVSAINTIPSCQSGDSSQVFAKTTGPCVAPAAPVIVATAANGSVTLDWAAVTGAVSYTVARSQTTGTGYSTIGTVTTGTTFTDGNVVNGVTYYYVVKASNGSCSSGNSNETWTSPACTPPVAPTGLTATAGNDSVTLKWAATAGGVSYSIYRNTTGIDPFTFVNSTAQLTFTDSSVVNDTKYYYVVRASNGSCASAISAVVSVTPACIPPSAPTGIVVTPADKQLGLSWTAPSGATQYRVSRSATATGDFTPLGTPTTSNYIDKPLSNGTAYYYVVAASNGSCWSLDSAVVSGIPACIPPPIPGILVTTPGAGQVSLAWGASTGATVYAIWRKIGAAGTYEQIGTATAATYTDTGLSNGTTYYYKVTAGNGSCTSDYNAEQPGTPVPSCTQTPPGGVKATPSGSVQVTVTWTAASPEPTSYSIARSETSGTGYTSIDSVAGTVLTYTDTDVTLLKNKTYYYQVIANGACTAASAESAATTACSTPAVPVPTVSNAKGAITVTWTAIDGATAYTVLRSDTVAGTYQPVSTNQTAATFTDPATGLTNGNTYYYEVTASNASVQCVSAASTPVSTMSCAPADVPVGIIRTVGTSGQVKLSWTASTGATQYTILRSTTSGAEVPIGTSGTTNYTDGTVTDWTTYYYEVSAQDGTGNACSSAASAEVTATPNPCPVLPGSANSYPPGNIGTGAYCFTTCWDLQSTSPVYGGLQANNLTGRTLTINGTSVNCPANGQCTLPTLTKDRSTYPISGAYVVRLSAGSSAYPSNNWWGTGAAHDCQ